MTASFHTSSAEGRWNTCAICTCSPFIAFTSTEICVRTYAPKAHCLPTVKRAVKISCPHHAWHLSDAQSIEMWTFPFTSRQSSESSHVMPDGPQNSAHLYGWEGVYCSSITWTQRPAFLLTAVRTAPRKQPLPDHIYLTARLQQNWNYSWYLSDVHEKKSFLSRDCSRDPWCTKNMDETGVEYHILHVFKTTRWNVIHVFQVLFCSILSSEVSHSAFFSRVYSAAELLVLPPAEG